MFCNMYVANNSSILQYCHGMSIEGVLVFYRTAEYANSWKGGGGGLTARQKRKSSLLRPPPPLFFLKVGRKGGGRNSGAVRYCKEQRCRAILVTLVQRWVPAVYMS